MAIDSITSALEHEHEEIDGGLARFLADPSADGASAAQLRSLISALRRHIYLEEEFVFPPLKLAGAFAAVLVMLREHGEIWRTLDAIESELRADDGARAAELGQQLLTQLEAHNEKEEPIIYSQLDAAITGAPAEDLRTFLATGTMPEGWVCAQAGRV